MPSHFHNPGGRCCGWLGEGVLGRSAESRPCPRLATQTIQLWDPPTLYDLCDTCAAIHADQPTFVALPATTAPANA